MANSLSKKEEICYGIGAFGKDLAYMLSATYVLYYFQDLLGVNAIAMGTILMVARIFDAFNDPIMGVIADRTRTRFGKFRPWLFIGTITNAVVLYVLFAAPPSLSGGGLVAYASIFYILWGVTYTMMDIPFWAMIPSFTDPGRDRERITQIARTTASVGAALVSVVTMVAVMALGHGDEILGFKRFALVTAIAFTVTVMVTVFGVEEESTVDMDTVPLKEMFKSFVKNDQALVVAVTMAIINTSFYTTANLGIYFYKYDVAGPNWYHYYTIFTIVGGASQIFAMTILFPILRKFFSPITVFRIGFGFGLIGYVGLLLLMFLTKNLPLIFCIPGAFCFLSNGILMVLVTVFLANSVDYGEYKNGTREESVVCSMQTFVVKLASGIAALNASICLSVFNINKDKTEAAVDFVISNTARYGLRASITFIPMLLLFVGMYIFDKRYKLTETKMEEIVQFLNEKRDKNAN